VRALDNPPRRQRLDQFKERCHQPRPLKLSGGVSWYHIFHQTGRSVTGPTANVREGAGPLDTPTEGGAAPPRRGSPVTLCARSRRGAGHSVVARRAPL